VAEELCGASGLLAVVVMGFSMSVMGETSDNHIRVQDNTFVRIQTFFEPQHQAAFAF
jgi:hypothetical protein